ncbi:MAG: NAD(P)H-binding protein [Epsilonproteobacteria bacterium]|nr:NAD(P)H-binding protein [Campylobacterota bacterium]OIO17638.1 MAG: epimerase [Helicobacteraceae bacterium CG1_02_36_14]PIP09629.1 MAG: epimerase [Sulfurimonas sp. CG23_combo_of_CG06-09_8_20_14_all_36_33]PIS26174.1 MAG: epimerase [Sulfurimonas sp. CG08_land_8_20_14_0_20_36_33]PIU34257.1 MAG: epimerase [Sulfurimonas sp. CG07_land_8_20_14_0_80_36_56]PIV02555.1 MAG: epimerase [Sulfurimonas sp. CG03_land_8_20_14_0_80_36_25]PIV34652.1 MAG: epimerase [Sulfurimonas sp. CG02_land_8_20_14_3_00_36_6
MRILLFGASGMVGQIALRAALQDADVTEIISVVRAPSHQEHPKLKEVVHEDFNDFSAIESAFSEIDACLFCLGVSSAGMGEEEYYHITYDITMSAAHILEHQSGSKATFIYITGAGTDSSEQGRSMWARVKGKTENDLQKLDFKAAIMFRPGVILPDGTIRSKTKNYQIIYDIFRPLFPLIKRFIPNYVTTAEQLGVAMMQAAKGASTKSILEIRDINLLK